MSEEDLIFGNLPGRRRRQLGDDDSREFREVPWFEEKGPLPWPWWRGGSAPVASGPVHSSQAVAYLARTVGGNEGGNGANIATLIDGLVADGVWTKLDALYVLAQQNSTDALLNLIGATYNIAPPLMSPPEAFTSLVGYSGFSTIGDQLDTGFNSTTAVSPKYTQNSASIGVWSVAIAADNAPVISSGTITVIYPNFSGGFYPRVNAAAISSVPTTATKGLFAGDRVDATNVFPYQNGVQGTGLTGASTVSDDATFWIGASHAGAATSNTLSAAFFGASLGASGQLALFNRLRTYMTAVGVP